MIFFTLRAFPILNEYINQKLWSGIRSIINVDKCKNSNITSILNNNEPVDNPNVIANIFSNLFANIGKTMEKGIPRGYLTLGVSTQDQFFYLLSLQMEFELLLVRWMLSSLLAHTVYQLLF